jgi:hypothetical protein
MPSRISTTPLHKAITTGVHELQSDKTARSLYTVPVKVMERGVVHTQFKLDEGLAG